MIRPSNFQICHQIASVILYATCTEYGPAAKGGANAADGNYLPIYYPMYQDVHVMIFIGRVSDHVVG